MMKKAWSEKQKDWVSARYFQIGLYNLILMMMLLLRSAGYFHPYLVISVNMIVVAALALGVVLLGLRSKGMFLVTFSFWIFAAFLRILQIEVWAERTAVYVYQAMVMGMVLVIYESFGRGRE